MRYLLVVLLSGFITLHAQERIEPSDTILITGKVFKEKTITIHALAKQNARPIGDVAITNHLGTVKGIAKNMKGVLLKELLDSNCFAEPVPRKLSEFYITCIASDGYKVVFSWNELFNTETGNHTFIVTEKEGKQLSGMDERILLVVPTDQKTGRRFVKGVNKIVISRTE